MKVDRWSVWAVRSQPRCARHAWSWRWSLRGASLTVVSLDDVFEEPGDCLCGMGMGTWKSLKHGCKLGLRGRCAGLLVSVDREGCALISTSLAVRSSRVACASSSSLSPTPKTQVSGKVPHAWPAERWGRMRQEETLPRPSLLARRVSLSNCVES